jgi:hypothetical protein
VVEEHGVTHLAAICAICKSQFTKVLPYYGFTMDMIVSVHQLVGNAHRTDRFEIGKALTETESSNHS